MPASESPDHIEFRIGTEGKIETIDIKTVEDYSAEDGSLLIKLHQEEKSLKGDTRDQKPRKLDYATAMMPGYVGMKNLPPEEAWALFNYKNAGEEGQTIMAGHINKNSPTLLLPLQAGVCPFDCKECPFALSFEENKAKKTKQIGVEETRILVQQSLEQAKKHNIDVSDIGVSFVGSGDATPNQHLEDIFKMIAKEFPNVRRVRFSTVAGKAHKGRLTPMQTVAKIIDSPEYKGHPQISIQVSAHNTDEDLRAAHVYEQRLSSEEVLSGERGFTVEDAKRMLLPLVEVAKQFGQIVQAQKDKGLKNIRKPTLTFVCTSTTKINLKSLGKRGFNPESTVVQLRPILSDDPKDCMKKEVFFALYHSLRDAQYDVVLMPVSPSGVELKAG